MPHRLLFAIAAVSVMAAAPAAQDWTPAGRTNGIQVDTRDDPALGAREVRATAEVPYPATRVIRVVCDFTQRLDPGVRESRILSGDLQADYTIYLRYAPRFMVVAARDVVINVRRQPHGCAWSEQPDAVAGPPGTVRMPLLRGSWVVEATGDTRSRVVYQVAVRPGGRIPGWMVRRGAASALPDVIERVTRCLSQASSGADRC